MLTDELKAEIQGAYSAFLEARGFRPRQCQRQMVAEVARTLSTDAEETAHRFCVIEAGTGTGKTVAYSLAAIPGHCELIERFGKGDAELRTRVGVIHDQAIRAKNLRA